MIFVEIDRCMYIYIYRYREVEREMGDCMCVHRGSSPEILTGTPGLTKTRVSVFTAL